MAKTSKGFDFKIEGIKEVQQLLKTLPASVNAKVQADLNQQAAKIVQAELIANAPDGDNNSKPKNKIESNVVIKTEKGSKSAKIIGFTKRVWYVKLIEMGTAVRTVLGKNDGFRKGANRGSMPSTPFIAKSHSDAAPKVIQFLQENYLKIIQKSIKKQAKAVQRALAKAKK